MQREISMKAIAPVLERARESSMIPGIGTAKAWAGPQPEGVLALQERLDANSTRAVWDLERGRIALTVTEHRSTRDALNALADELEANQLAELPLGPPDLGEISFVHPPEAPPAVFFVRGNLTLSVHSFSRERVDVLPFARRVDEALRGDRTPA